MSANAVFSLMEIEPLYNFIRFNSSLQVILLIHKMPFEFQRAFYI